MDVTVQCCKIPFPLTAGSLTSHNRLLMVYKCPIPRTERLKTSFQSVICWTQKQKGDGSVEEEGYLENENLPPLFSKNNKKPYRSVKKKGHPQNVDLPPLSKNNKKPYQSVKKDRFPQNVDLPSLLPKNKKKPYPIPLKEIQRRAREDKKLAQMGIEKPLEPPANGLLVPELIPVAHEVLNAWGDLIRGLAQLLHVIPVYACSECSEVVVAETGHGMQNCQGSNSNKRQGFHVWVKGSINDVLIPIESYHLFDPFGQRIKHDTRFNYDRIPAIVELCIQAGVDLSGYPSRRRRNPIRMIGRKIIDRGGFLEDPTPNLRDSSALQNYDTQGALLRFPPPPPSDLPRVAQETMNAYVTVAKGVRKLMAKYSIKACGYCPEVHVGPWGHDAKLCGEFKHQWRDGKHGWQDATVDEVFPPNYVWHVRDPKGPPLRTELKRYYGKAPAVVEVCHQAGGKVPKNYQPMMRLDIVLPDSEEAQFVA